MSVKASSPKLNRKSLDDLFDQNSLSNKNAQEVVNIDIANLVRNKLQMDSAYYTGEQLDDFVENIKTYGVLSALFVRQISDRPGYYEILAGHNRHLGAKLAGLLHVPCVILHGLTDEQADEIFAFTNIFQRNFETMSESERSSAITIMHKQIASQGKRNDIIARLNLLDSINGNLGDSTGGEVVEDFNKKAGARDVIGIHYGLSSTNVSRYLRIGKYLVAELKDSLDDGKIGFGVAEKLSYLPGGSQTLLADKLDLGHTIDLKTADAMVVENKRGGLSDAVLEKLLIQSSLKPRSLPSIKVRSDVYSKHQEYLGGLSKSQISDLFSEWLDSRLSKGGG